MVPPWSIVGSRGKHYARSGQERNVEFSPASNRGRLPCGEVDQHSGARAIRFPNRVVRVAFEIHPAGLAKIAAAAHLADVSEAHRVGWPGCAGIESEHLHPTGQEAVV